MRARLTIQENGKNGEKKKERKLEQAFLDINSRDIKNLQLKKDAEKFSMRDWVLEPVDNAYVK